MIIVILNKSNQNQLHDHHIKKLQRYEVKQMPYKESVGTWKGHKTFNLKNLDTGKIIHFTSSKNREKGKHLRLAIEHGFKFTKLK